MEILDGDSTPPEAEKNNHLLIKVELLKIDKF